MIRVTDEMVEAACDVLESMEDMPLHEAVRAALESFEAGSRIGNTERERILSEVDGWWTRYQAVLDEGPMYELGRIIAKLREP